MGSRELMPPVASSVLGLVARAEAQTIKAQWCQEKVES